MTDKIIRVEDESIFKVGTYKVVDKEIIHKTKDFYGFCKRWVAFPLGFVGVGYVLDVIKGDFNAIPYLLMMIWIGYVMIAEINRTEKVGVLQKVEQKKNG
jgi:hypothetical protein